MSCDKVTQEWWLVFTSDEMNQYFYGFTGTSLRWLANSRGIRLSECRSRTSILASLSQITSRHRYRLLPMAVGLTRWYSVTEILLTRVPGRIYPDPFLVV